MIKDEPEQSQLEEAAKLRWTFETLDDELVRVQAERAADKVLHELHLRHIHEPQRRKEAEELLEQDRENFPCICRELGISGREANFRLIREVIGPGFQKHDIQKAIDSNSLHLIPASPEELTQWREENEERRREFLLNEASPQQLRTIAKRETEQRRLEAAKAEDQRQIAAREQKDAGLFPPLPEAMADGTPLNSKLFIHLSNTNLSTFKLYIKKYGAAQVTRALRERI